MLRIYLLAVLLVCSCKNKGNTKRAVDDKTATKLEVPQLKDNLSIQKLRSLTKPEAVEQFGTPNSDEQFILDDAQGEFRIGLNNFYTKEQRRTTAIRIHEVTWEKDKNTWITVWYEVKQEKLLPIDVYSWEKGSEF